jgi:O-antigen ligase
MTSALKKCLTIGNLRAFYMGYAYPAVITALVLIGAVFGVEIVTYPIHTALLFGAFLISKSIKPILISLLTYVMQVSVYNSPFYPNYSDYYYTGWRLPLFITLGALTLAGIVTFFFKNKIYLKVNFKKTPLLLPILILSAAFLTNGLFSGKWAFGNILFGLANVVVYFFVFIMIYHGLGEERAEESTKYFSYVSVLICLIISVEIAANIITNENAIVNGAINKVEMALGWGIWNLVGVSLAVLIPVIFYGVFNNRYPWIYFAAATLSWIMAVITMSRNALIFSSLAYGACVIIACFKGKNKKAFRIITALGILLFIAFAIVFWDKVYAVFSDYFSRGLSDNGRFKLWKAAFKNFLDSPLFGGGFYGFDVETDVFGPLAKQAHNTVLQLLSAMGVVGFLAYFYYRYKTALYIFKNRSLSKTLMAISIGVFLFSSLLDNFVFNVYPVFYYTVALVIIIKEDEE